MNRIRASPLTLSYDRATNVRLSGAFPEPWLRVSGVLSSRLEFLLAPFADLSLPGTGVGDRPHLTLVESCYYSSDSRWSFAQTHPTLRRDLIDAVTSSSRDAIYFYSLDVVHLPNFVATMSAFDEIWVSDPRARERIAAEFPGKVIRAFPVLTGRHHFQPWRDPAFAPGSRRAFDGWATIQEDPERFERLFPASAQPDIVDTHYRLHAKKARMLPQRLGTAVRGCPDTTQWSWLCRHYDRVAIPRSKLLPLTRLQSALDALASGCTVLAEGTDLDAVMPPHALGDLRTFPDLGATMTALMSSHPERRPCDTGELATLRAVWREHDAEAAFRRRLAERLGTTLERRDVIALVVGTVGGDGSTDLRVGYRLARSDIGRVICVETSPVLRHQVPPPRRSSRATLRGGLKEAAGFNGSHVLLATTKGLSFMSDDLLESWAPSLQAGSALHGANCLPSSSLELRTAADLRAALAGHPHADECAVIVPAEALAGAMGASSFTEALFTLLESLGDALITVRPGHRPGASR